MEGSLVVVGNIGWYPRRMTASVSAAFLDSFQKVADMATNTKGKFLDEPILKDF